MRCRRILERPPGNRRWATPMEGVGWFLAVGNLTLDGTQDGFPHISSMTESYTSICEIPR